MMSLCYVITGLGSRSSTRLDWEERRVSLEYQLTFNNSVVEIGLTEPDTFNSTKFLCLKFWLCFSMLAMPMVEWYVYVIMCLNLVFRWDHEYKVDL